MTDLDEEDVSEINSESAVNTAMNSSFVDASVNFHTAQNSQPPRNEVSLVVENSSSFFGIYDKDSLEDDGADFHTAQTSQPPRNEASLVVENPSSVLDIYNKDSLEDDGAEDPVDKSCRQLSLTPSQGSSFELDRKEVDRLLKSERGHEIRCQKVKIDWKTESKFHVTLKPTVLQAGISTKVDQCCQSDSRLGYFNQQTCEYNIPIDGEYAFVVTQQGHNVVCCLCRDDGKRVKLVSRGNIDNRGSAKMTVKWKCCTGQKVWIEAQGTEKDCDMTVVLNGWLFNHHII